MLRRRNMGILKAVMLAAILLLAASDTEPRFTPDMAGRYNLYWYAVGDNHLSEEDFPNVGLEGSYISVNADGVGYLATGNNVSSITFENSGRAFVNYYGRYNWECRGDVFFLSSFGVSQVYVRKDAKINEEIPFFSGNELPYYLSLNQGEKAKASDKESCLRVYESSPFFDRLMKVIRTGNLREDAVAIAESQIGYHEGNNEDDLGGLNALGEGDYVEYENLSDNYGAYWGSEFVSWCIRMAGLPSNCLSTSVVASAKLFTEGTSAACYEWKDTIYGGGSYKPKTGDIILVTFDTDPYDTETFLGQSALVKRVTDTGDGKIVMRVIEGNASNAVMESDYLFYKRGGHMADCEGRLAYIISPNYESEKEKVLYKFDPNGGSTDKDSIAVFKGGMIGPLPMASMDGKTFDGWYTATNGGTRISMYYECNDFEEKTFYAHWR